MNIKRLTTAIKHIVKNTPCINCGKKVKSKNINILATTEKEALLDIKCEHCESSSIMSVLNTPQIAIKEQNPERVHSGISDNDILDIKNFLSRFDGNFKKIFTKKK